MHILQSFHRKTEELLCALHPPNPILARHKTIHYSENETPDPKNKIGIQTM